MDDTFVIQQESHKQLFLDHINNFDPAVKFTVESNQENGAIPFLGTLVKPETYNSLSISVYRKPTHTYQYLQWDSHHNLAAKYNAIGTLTHRAKMVCTGLELFNMEIQHLREALYRYKYTKWALDKNSKVSLLPATSKKVTPNKMAQAKWTTALVVTPQKGPPRKTQCRSQSSHILKG